MVILVLLIWTGVGTCKRSHLRVAAFSCFWKNRSDAAGAY